MNKPKTLKRHAYALITVVIIVMTVLLVFLSSFQMISTSGLDSTLGNRMGTEAQYVSEACLEDTLVRLKANSLYNGGSLNLADGYCTISISDSAPNEKLIQIEASTLNAYYQHLEVLVGITETTDTKKVYIISKTRT